MAATIRKHEEHDIGIAAKKQKTSANDDNLRNFLLWCKENRLSLNNMVKVSRENSCAHYGMFAIEDIPEGEILFEIPRNLLLKPENSLIMNYISTDPNIQKNKSGWVPVIISIMYEFHQPKSRWRPYLDIVPNFEDIEPPLFWEESEFEGLKGTGVKEAVELDLKNISEEFNQFVLPFVCKHTELFPVICQDLEFYKKMVAFVMAYSFTEPEDEDESDDEDEVKTAPPMMVPMADILNHVAKNNANLSFGEDSLKMVSVRAIKKGEEIFNTYGQLSNSQLLHMYGFSEQYPNNHYDTVEMPVSLLLKVIKEDDIQMLEEKCEILEKTGILVDDGSFVLGIDGILTEEEFLQVLKVLEMTKEQLQEYKENDGWSDDESTDGNEASLSFDSIPKLPEQQRKLIAGFATLCLDCYSADECSDEEMLTSNELKHLTIRKQMCLHVRHGQRKLLHKLIDECRIGK